MGQLVLGVAGAAAGFAIGGPLGARVGFAAGAMIGGAIFAPKLPTIKNSQQPISDLRVVGAEYGQPIPYVIGSALVAGQMWWNTDRRAISTTTTTRSGGKGGGGQKTKTTTIVYEMDCLIGLTTDREIVGIARIWDNGKLIFNSSSDATAGTLDASFNAGNWDRLTVYTGSLTQMPDPTYETAIGEGFADAYRGRAYVFIEGFDLGSSGTVRNLTFEVVTDGAEVTTDGITNVVYGTENAVDDYTGTDFCYATARGLGAVWSVHNHEQPDASLQLIDIHSGEPIEDIPHESFNPAYLLPSPGDMRSLLVPVGVDDTGNVYLRTGGSSQIVCKAGIDGTVGFIRTVSKDLTFRGICFNSDGDMFGSLAGDSVIWRVNEAHALFGATPSGPSMTESIGDNTLGRFARNAGGISDRVYFIRPGGTQIAYMDNQIIPEGHDVGGPITNGTPVVVGDDGNIYCTSDVGDPTSTIEKRDAAGTLVASLVVPGSVEAGYFDTDGFLWCNGFTDDIEFHKIDPVTMTLVQTISNPDIDPPADGAGYRNLVGEPQDGYIAVDRVGLGGIGYIHSLTVIEKSCVPVHVAASRLFLRSGLAADQFDVTALEDITREVCSMAVSQVAPGRTPLELLMSCYFWEMTVSDKIYCRPRGVSAVATIPYGDLGATVGADAPEPLPLLQSNDLELPAQLALTYINIDDDYQPDTQYSDRLISAVSGTVAAVQMAIGMHPSEAKQVADTTLLDQAASVLSAPISVLSDYARLEPTDPVLVLGFDGSQFRMRIVKWSDSFPVLGLDLILDDPSVLSTQGITSTNFSPQTIVDGPVDTLMRLMDIPILRDSDDDSGFYVATKGDDEPYPGSAIFDSPDDVHFEQRETIEERAIFGRANTALGDWAGGRVVDEINSVVVDVGDGTLSSSTRALVIGSQEINPFLIGDELIQAILCTPVSPGVYRLSRLLRGSRGSEWAMTGHAVGERVVFLQEAGIRRLATQTSELGIERYYKGVTLGRNESTADSEAFTNNAVGLKPFSPVDLRITRDLSDNITGTFRRRTRLSTRFLGDLGVSVPLGEETESYRVEIYADDSYTTVVRNILTASQSFAYSALEQAADGLTPGNAVNFRIKQISAVVGPGYPLELEA